MVCALGVDGKGALGVWDCGPAIGGAEKVFWSEGSGYKGDDGKDKDEEGGLGW
jgi:hypothetical protein